MRNNRVEDAVRFFSDVLLLNPAHREAFHHRAKCYVIVKREEDASADFLRAAEADPSWDLPLHERGHLLSSLGKVDEALKAYEGALRRAPANGELRYHCGEMKLRAGRWDEALLDFESAIQAGHSESYLYKADALKSLGKFPEALRTLHEGLKVHLVSPRSHAPDDRGFRYASICVGMRPPRRAASLT
jgi:tetratricopeptide (TPR) repeat protein